MQLRGADPNTVAVAERNARARSPEPADDRRESPKVAAPRPRAREPLFDVLDRHGLLSDD